MTKKTFTAPTASLAACLLAFTLAGCVGAGSTSAPGAPAAPLSGSPGQGANQPAQTPVGSPVLVSPPPGAATLPPAAASTPASGSGGSGTFSVPITMADNGKTVHVTIGQILAVSLSDGVRWSLKVSDGNVIRQVPDPIPTGVQGIYQAVGAGTSTLGGAGKPDCSGTGFCPMFLLQFTVTIVVS